MASTDSDDRRLARPPTHILALIFLMFVFFPSSVSFTSLDKVKTRSGLPSAPGRLIVPFLESIDLIIPRNGKKVLFFLAGFSVVSFLSPANADVSVNTPPSTMAADNKGINIFFIDFVDWN